MITKEFRGELAHQIAIEALPLLDPNCQERAFDDLVAIVQKHLERVVDIASKESRQRTEDLCTGNKLCIIKIIKDDITDYRGLFKHD